MPTTDKTGFDGEKEEDGDCFTSSLHWYYLSNKNHALLELHNLEWGQQEDKACNAKNCRMKHLRNKAFMKAIPAKHLVRWQNCFKASQKLPKFQKISFFSNMTFPTPFFILKNSLQLVKDKNSSGKILWILFSRFHFSFCGLVWH